jgi:hypothetical protein
VLSENSVAIARGVMAVPEAWKTLNSLYEAKVLLAPLSASDEGEAFIAHVALDIRELHIKRGATIHNW